MGGEVLIRPLTEQDFEQFTRLQQEALRLAPEAFGSDYDSYQALSLLDKEQQFEALLHYPYNYLLGVFVEGKLVGMAGFSCEHTKPKLRHKGRIWGMYITPEYRGRGLGEQLLRRLLTAAKEDSRCEQALLSVATTNQAAYGLYLKMGFLRYGTEYRALKLGDTYVDEHLMMRLL
ncbi:MAG: GNAT family N-acetyltransferase [Candidatus Kapabacteria bacterium]|nr:GNAT family N-acetyltransferase [Candidatus Kapabacteria bacterium]MDW8224831.1 GNAT family N-acetyltransferase [Bacteroidota bacterium]